MSLDKFQFLHRFTGLTVILFVLFFAVTGILLNHASQFNMNKKYIDFDWLLNLYSIVPPQPPVSYAVDNSWLTLIDTRLYFNDHELPERTVALLGTVQLDGVVLVALQDAVLLLTDTGDIIEKITPVNGLPDGLQKIGKLNHELFIIATPSGNYANTPEIGEWQMMQTDTVDWSTPGQLPETSLKRILALYRGSGLTLERALQDLHSGRLLGRWKIIIVDVVSLLLMISAISGLSMWYKKKKLLSSIK